LSGDGDQSYPSPRKKGPGSKAPGQGGWGTESPSEKNDYRPALDKIQEPHVPKFETLLEGLTFPEGPRWREGRLWFSDFYTHRVIAVDPEGRAETMAEVPQQPSGLGWTPDG